MNVSASHCDWTSLSCAIILCTCQWTSPFWCTCERTLTSHLTPPHPRSHVDECECKSLYWTSLSCAIILCTCQWTSPFWCTCERTLTSHLTPPHPRSHVDECECKSLWLNVIILCHYPLYVSVNVPILVHMWKDVNIPPHPTPPQIACWWMWVQVIVTEHHYLVHVSVIVALVVRVWRYVNIPPHPRCACWWILSVVTSFPRSWLIVRCVSAQVSEIYVTQCASEWNFQCASGCLSYSIYVYLSLINLSVFLSYFSYRSYSSYLSYLSRIDLESRIYLE